MEANELMVGDWVYKPKYNGDTLTYTAEEVDVGDLHFGKIYEFKEIPLTPDILEKNGFSDKYAEDDLSYATDYSGDVIAVHICGNGGIMDEMYFKYVHELQHAMRLCGIEKEIIV